MSENFTFNVSYSTTFEHLETLREKMLAFLQENSRDYQVAFDVAIVGKKPSILSLSACLACHPDFPEQEKMTLSVDIKYKSNAQQGALKGLRPTVSMTLLTPLSAKRRNKWICALKEHLSEVQIFGPKGNPNTSAGPTRYTQVPWEEVQAEERRAKREKAHSTEPVGGWRLADKNADMCKLSACCFMILLKTTADNDADNVFGDTSQLNMTNPRRNLSQGASAAAPVPVVMPGMPPMTQMPQIPPGQGLP